MWPFRRKSTTTNANSSTQFNFCTPCGRCNGSADNYRCKNRCGSTDLITSDIDPVDKAFITGERTPEGFYRTNAGLDRAIARGLAYAPYADLVWCETSEPNLEDAKRFADAIHKEHPGKLLAYNCSPSFNWKQKLDEKQLQASKRKSHLTVTSSNS